MSSAYAEKYLLKPGDEITLYEEYGTDAHTFRVDGVTYAGKLADGKTAKTGLFVSGALVSCIIDTAGKTVNFKAGGGYAEGDVIAAGKLAEVYENAVKYSTLELIGEGALQWNERSFINPAGTIVYTYSSDNKVTTSTIDGTAIATVDTGRGFRCALGFDDAGNFYVQAYTSGSSYESVLRLNTDGTYQVFSDLWSALGTSMFWAYNSFYTHGALRRTARRQQGRTPICLCQG